MERLLNDLANYRTLERGDAQSILQHIADGVYNDSQIAAFLTVFMMRDITVAELGGFRDALLQMCHKVDLSDYQAMDVCGTGGDGKNTFNISTLSAFVVAAAGQNVAKHGNNGVSSVCGSSNLLMAFGYEFATDQQQLIRDLDAAGICFLHAPLYHPAMKNVAPVRKELGVKTFFNMLGPLVNPSFPQSQMLGVFSLELARLYNYLFQDEEKRYLIVHSLDGYDEISLTGPFKTISNEGEKVYYPQDLGLQTHNPEQLHGGVTIEESAKIFKNILDGKGTEAQNEVVIANAGFALFAVRLDQGLEIALEKAKEALLSGAAKQCFDKLINKKELISINPS